MILNGLPTVENKDKVAEELEVQIQDSLLIDFLRNRIFVQ